jgi:hypothetical protein
VLILTIKPDDSAWRWIFRNPGSRYAGVWHYSSVNAPPGL